MNSMKENKMGTEPVRKILIKMGVPMIISMMLQAFYNIVDSAFVSNMKENGELALNAMTLAFPVQMLMVAVGIGTGVGVNALVSKSLGQGERERAGNAAGNAIFLAVVIYLCFALFGLVGTRAYVATQTKNTQIVSMTSDYLRICCSLSLGIVFFSIFEKLLQASGKTLFSTIAQVVGAVINIILDPILIYGLCGLPELGVRGAAYATILGQIASFLCALVFHFKFNKEIPNRLAYLRPRAVLVKNIYAIGLPAIIAQALMSMMTYALNIILDKLGENMVTAYGLYYKIQQFILFAAFGLRDAITPVVSFNHGKNSRSRVSEGVRYGLVYTLVIMLLGFILLEVFADTLAGVFGLSGETKELCVSAIRVISVSYLFAGTNIALQGVFQALDSGLESLIISICRQFLFVVPLAYLFTKFVLALGAPIWLVWSTFVIAEGVSALMSVIFMVRIRKNKIQKMA